MRGKQSVRKGVWYIGGRNRRRRKIYSTQRNRGFPIGLIASAAAPFLGEIAKPILKNDDELSHSTLLCQTVQLLLHGKREQVEKTYLAT